MVSRKKESAATERAKMIQLEELEKRLRSMKAQLDLLNARLDAVKSDRDDVLLAMAEMEYKIDQIKQGQLPLEEH
jgi:hypothetical protein